MTTEFYFIFAAIVAIYFIRARFRHEFLVAEGFSGLIYHDGKFAGTLSAGRHVRWGSNYRLACVDIRKALLTVAGQDVLTADNVGVKLSVVLTIQVVDAAQSVLAVDNATSHVYSAAQTAVRVAVAGVTMDALLTQRISIGAQLREIIEPLARAVGLQLHGVEVRDVMLPGDLRKAFSEVLKAKQEGQAALERARGESAALRNLANAARLIENQPGLATLRFLQTLEASEAGQTLVMNDLSALLPALQSRRAQPPSTEAGAA